MLRTSQALLPLLLLSVACGGGGSSSSSSDANVPKNLSYGLPRQSLMTGLEIELVPSFKGAIATWSVDPALPSGLALGADGSIAGTPTDVADEQAFVVTGSGNKGTAKTTLQLRIANPSSWAYVANVTDGSVSAFALDAVTGSLHPAGHWVDPLATPFPEQAVPHPDGDFVYVPNLGLPGQGSNVSVFERVGDRLEPRTPASIGTGPHEFAFSPSGEVAYVTSQGSDHVRAFQVDLGTGALTPLGPPLQVADQPQPLAVDPLGRFVFVGSKGGASVEVVPLDAMGNFAGPAQSFSLNNSIPTALRVDPTGRFLIAAIDNFKLLITLEIDGQGDLTTVGTEATGDTPSSLAIHPRGDAAFVVNAADDTLVTYRLDAATGALDQTQTLQTGAGPNWVAVDELGTQVVVTCGAEREVQVYDARDPLALALERTYLARAAPRGAGFLITPAPLRPTIRNVYAANAADGSIDMLAVDAANGTASTLAPAVPAGSDPFDVVVDPFGQFAFAAVRGDDAVRTYAVDDTTGMLTQIGAPFPVAGEPSGMAVDASGRTLYVASLQNDVVSSYSIDRGTGALTFVDQVPTGADPVAVLVDPTERFLYTANQGAGSVGAYRVDEGEFTGFGTGATLGDASSLAISASGDVLYATLSLVDQAVPLAIDPGNGNLTALGPVAVPGGPEAIALHPFAPRAYLALATTGDVGRYGVGAGGALTPLGQVDSGLGTVDLAIDPRGDLLFSLNRDGDDVTVYGLSEGGLPTETGRIPVGDSPVSLGLHVRVQ